ncbi:hypothetical protein MPER_01755 [Moniliophthora perniciosa FA553]|nr:hypothetical protein MPER_01755 [Moniliophthora perniciosa FA553]
MALPRQSSILEAQGDTTLAYLSRDSLKFDEQTLRFIKAVNKAISGLGGHCVSRATVVARSMLDMLYDQSIQLEEEINNFLRTRQWTEERLALLHRRTGGFECSEEPRTYGQTHSQFGEATAILRLVGRNPTIVDFTVIPHDVGCAIP